MHERQMNNENNVLTSFPLNRGKNMEKSLKTRMKKVFIKAGNILYSQGNFYIATQYEIFKTLLDQIIHLGRSSMK